MALLFLVVAAHLVLGQARPVTSCTPDYTELSPSRVHGKSPSVTGARVLLIGCKEQLYKLSAEDRAEIYAAISSFFAKEDWTFWWRAKEPSVRRDLLAKTSAFRAGLVTDVLFFDPVSGEP